MSEFFRNGWRGDVPRAALWAAVLWAMRLERRHLWLMMALAVTSVAAGLLALSGSPRPPRWWRSPRCGP